MSKFSRRKFLMGCSAAIAHMTGARLSYTAFGNPEEEPNQQILITVFLRGGCDALSLLPPLSGDDFNFYRTARPELYLPNSGLNAALPLNDQFGLHPSAAPLYDLYTANKLAVVHAAGLPSDTRSHFDAMSYMELGTPNSKSSTTGWLSRHLNSLGLDDTPQVPAFASGSLAPQSLLGFYDTVATNNANSFNLNVGYNRWRDERQDALQNLYSLSNTTTHQAGRRTLDTVKLFQDNSVGSYEPVVDNYPNDSFGRNLKLVAQMIRLQVGLRAATVDLGGWDTHDQQAGGDPTAGYFSDIVGRLSTGLAALYEDLEAAGGGLTDRVTVVVMSEFGRRLRENGERGTDHGHGGMMLVLGGRVNGGQVYGAWPGLSGDALYDNADLAVANDYRQILSEILVRQMQNPKLGYIFPNYTSYNPLGIVQGEDLPIDYSSTNGAYKVHLPMVTSTP